MISVQVRLTGHASQIAEIVGSYNLSIVSYLAGWACIFPC